MGFLSRITNRNTDTSNNTLSAGGHGIDKSKVLQATDPTVINPSNPGNWESIRTAPVVPRPTEFTREQAEVLRHAARHKTATATETQKAYRALARIEKADATVHQAHRRYQGKVSDFELTKIRSNARLARHLHATRPEYARLSNGLDRAENSAQQRIDQLKAKVNQAYG